MIQLSSPLQIPNSPQDNVSAENSTGSSSLLWGQKAHKKNKAGIFAKLLDGLVLKNKAEKPGSEDPLLVPEKPGKNSNKTGQIPKKTPGLEFFEAAFLNTITQGPKNPASLAFSRSNAEKITKTQTEQDALTFIPKEKGYSRFREAPPRVMKQPFADVSNPHVKKEGDDKAPPAGIVLTRSEKEAAEKQAFSGTEKQKSTNRVLANYLSGSFREMEERFLRSGNSFVPGAESFISGTASKGEANERSGDPSSMGRGKKDKPNIHVRDLRTGSDIQKSSGPELGIREISKGEVSHRPVNTEMELSVDLGNRPGKGAVSGKGREEPFRGASFEDALARELRSNLSADIVRDASVIVRNGGEGTIRLSLRPASLGDVKIRLEMAENKITGHFVVGSNEALRAFERELPVLEKAFRDSGFSETNLSMSLAQDGGNFGAGQQGYGADNQMLNPVLAASRYDAAQESSVMDTPEGEGISGGAVLQTSPGVKTVNLFV